MLRHKNIVLVILTFGALESVSTWAQDSAIAVDSVCRVVSMRASCVPVPSQFLSSAHKNTVNNNFPFRIQTSMEGTDVGTIDITEGFTPTGGRIYDIPIPTGEGLRPSPTISLHYDSQAGNGPAGYGWTIAGIPRITLANKTAYFEGFPWPGRLSEPEGAVYRLDGVPLIANEGHLSDDYPLRSFSGGILVRKISAPISGFEALYPNGSRALFGVERITTSYSEYPLYRLEDKDGNVAEFSYHGSDLVRYIHEIRYGQSSNGVLPGKICFDYADREDSVTEYRGGWPYRNEKLLKSITSISYEDTLAIFTLNHEVEDGVSQLRGLGCRNHEGRLPSASFSYGTQNGGEDSLFVASSQSFLQLDFPDTTRKYEFLRGKFVPGDSSDGVLVYPWAPNYIVVSSRGLAWNPKRQFGSGQTAGQVFLLANSLSDFTSIYDNVITAGEGFQDIACIDADGDGVDEIVKLNDVGCASDGKSLLQITIYKYGSSSFRAVRTFSVALSGTITEGDFKSPYRRAYRYGDFLGNGTTQLAAVSYSDNGYGVSQQSGVALISLSLGHLVGESTPFVLPFEKDKCLLSLDLDADGRTELYHVTVGGFVEYVAASSGAFEQRKTLSGLGEIELCGSDKKSYAVGDLNGDGYPDFLVSNNYGSPSEHWKAYYYNGDDAFVSTLCQIPSHRQNEKLFLSDIDRDGLADLVTFNGSEVTVHLNENGGFRGDGIAQSAVSALCGSHPEPVACRRTTLGESTDFFIHDRFNIVGFHFCRDARENRLLTCVGDGTGVYYENAYSDLDNETGCSLGSGTLERGYLRERFPLMILTYSQHSFGGTRLDPTRLSYEGPVVSREGLGFCGFEKIEAEVRDAFGSNPIVTTTRRDPSHFGVTLSRQTALLGEALYESAEYEYDFRYKKLPLLVRSSEGDSLSGLSTVKEYAYDSLDFPKRIVTTNSRGGIEGPKTTRTLSYRHNLCSEPYSIGAIATDVSITRKDSIVKPRLSLYEYDVTNSYSETDSLFYDEKMRLCRIVHRGGEARMVKELPPFIGEPVDTLKPLRTHGRWEPEPPPTGFNYSKTLLETRTISYDEYGNPYEETLYKRGSAEPLTVSTHWSPDGALPYSRTDEIGRTTIIDRCDIWGNPLETTDYRGNKTYRQYDPWGNPTLTTNADGSFERINRRWLAGGGSEVLLESPDVPTVRIVYDPFGREILRGDRRFDGREVLTKTEYDARGRIARVSTPYFGASAEHWTNYEYDRYGRLLRVLRPDGSADSLAYNGAQKSKTSYGVTRSTRKDANGRIVSVTDPGGSVDYSYDICSRLSQVKAPGNILTTFQYDRYGNRKRIDDPSAGIQTDSTAYLQSGVKLTFSHNRHGDSQTIEDKFGRVIRSIVGVDTTTFYYTTDGLLQSAECSNGTKTEYAYDIFGRTRTIERTLPGGKLFSQNYSYDSLSRIASLRQTSSEGLDCTENYSYQNGALVQISLSDGTIVWRLDEEDALGRATEQTVGPLTKEYEFDLADRTTELLVRHAETSLCSRAYRYDPFRGNLTQRSDFLNSRTEVFDYDALNRLSNENGRALEYDQRSNITRREGVGEMGYSRYDLTSFSPESSETSSSFGNLEMTCRPDGLPKTLSRAGICAAFDYGPEDERVRLSSGNEQTYYAAGRYEAQYEGDSLVCERLYLEGDAKTAPAVLVRVGQDESLYFVERDPIGSVILITDSEGIKQAEYSYDAWGRADSLQIENFPLFWRGFAGYEYLPGFEIYNAGARLYDPVLGRFLSPDPYVTDPLSTLALNRYLYCLNNPLRYSDPNGEFVLTTALIIGAAIGVGVGIGLWQGYEIGRRHGAEGWKMAGYMIGGGLIGGLSSAAGSFIGASVGASIAVGGFVGGMATGAAGGFVNGNITGFGLSLLNGDSLGDALLQGISYGFAGAALGTLLGGAIQGIEAVCNGGNFWTGNITPAAQVKTPYQKGQEGVERAIKQLQDKGHEILGQEVTLDVPEANTRVRVDLVTSHDDKINFIEVKNGPHARMTPNQRIAYPLMQHSTPVVPIGKNVLDLNINLRIGIPTTNYKFYYFHF